VKSIDWIGEFYCLYNVKTNYYYTAGSELKTFGINKYDLLKALEKQQELCAKLRRKAYRRYTDYIKSFLEKKIKEEIENYNKINRNFTINRVAQEQVNMIIL
jgi:hypothetical protein